jgi:hypothetical protein
LDVVAAVFDDAIDVFQQFFREWRHDWLLGLGLRVEG